VLADPGVRAAQGVSLRPLSSWTCRFEYRWGHGYLSFATVVFYQVEVSVTGWSLVQRSPTECGVSECNHEASIMRRPWPTGGCCAMDKKNRVPNFCITALKQKTKSLFFLCYTFNHFSWDTTLMSLGTERLYLLAFAPAQITSTSFLIAHTYFRTSFLYNIDPVELNSVKIPLWSLLHIQITGILINVFRPQKHLRKQE
jgi:hypothetical protein